LIPLLEPFGCTSDRGATANHYRGQLLEKAPKTMEDSCEFDSSGFLRLHVIINLDAPNAEIMRTDLGYSCTSLEMKISASGRQLVSAVK
jgi:hypothetical protein